MGKLKCPRCRSAAIQIMPIAQNMKQKHSININPLQPLSGQAEYTGAGGM